MNEQERIEYTNHLLSEIDKLQNKLDRLQEVHLAAMEQWKQESPADLELENLELKAQVDLLADLLEQSVPHVHSRRAKGKAPYDLLVKIQKVVSKLRQAAKSGE